MNNVCQVSFSYNYDFFKDVMRFKGQLSIQLNTVNKVGKVKVKHVHELRFGKYKEG